MLIEVKGRNLLEAKDKEHALMIDPEGELLFRINYTVTSDSPITIKGVKVVFTLLDLDVYSNTSKLNFELPSGSKLQGLLRIAFKDYARVGNIQIMSGIYKLRIEVNYSKKDREVTLPSQPFYVKIEGNPVMTVIGAVATAAVVTAGASAVGLAQSIKSSIDVTQTVKSSIEPRSEKPIESTKIASPNQLAKLVESTQVSPSDQLLNFLKGETSDGVQKELSQRILGFVKKTWRGDRCPSCNSDWSKGKETCQKCGITLDEAERIYSKSLAEKCLKATGEIANSVSGLDVSQLAQRLGEEIPATADIISCLAKSGLAFVEPRVSKRLKVSRRRLVATGLYICVTTLFWIQACGLEAVNIYLLTVAIIAGLILPIIINRVLDNLIRSTVQTFWKNKLEST